MRPRFMTTLLPPDISLKALLKLAGPIFVANVAIIGSGTRHDYGRAAG